MNGKNNDIITSIPIEFQYKGKNYKGFGRPVRESCRDGVCFRLDVTLNDLNLGQIHKKENGWVIENFNDQGLVDAIGEEILLWYE